MLLNNLTETSLALAFIPGHWDTIMQKKFASVISQRFQLVLMTFFLLLGIVRPMKLIIILFQANYNQGKEPYLGVFVKVKENKLLCCFCLDIYE